MMGPEGPDVTGRPVVSLNYQATGPTDLPWTQNATVEECCHSYMLGVDQDGVRYVHLSLNQPGPTRVPTFSSGLTWHDLLTLSR